MLTRPIPRTGELLPVIGLGTWQTFDVDPGKQAVRAPLVEVVRRFTSGAPGGVIDSSPMYGNAERVTGDLLAELGDLGSEGAAKRPFLATKVWTRGRAQGIEEMNRSFDRMRAKRMDLMQIHNLLDWQTHLPVLREWKAEGRIRYVGITHYKPRRVRRDGEDPPHRGRRTSCSSRTTSPIARPRSACSPRRRKTGTAVLVMRPFDERVALAAAARQGAAVMGGGARLHELVVAALEVHPRAPRGHVPDPRDVEPRPPQPQPARRRGPNSRRIDAKNASSMLLGK